MENVRRIHFVKLNNSILPSGISFDKSTMYAITFLALALISHLSLYFQSGILRFSSANLKIS